MNNSQPRSKVGLLDLEVNQLTKVYCWLLKMRNILVFVFRADFISCRGRTCVVDDVFERISGTMVPISFPLRPSLFLHNSH